jgi:hypothetical protein
VDFAGTEIVTLYALGPAMAGLERSSRAVLRAAKKIHNAYTY